MIGFLSDFLNDLLEKETNMFKIGDFVDCTCGDPSCGVQNKKILAINGNFVFFGDGAVSLDKHLTLSQQTKPQGLDAFFMFNSEFKASNPHAHSYARYVGLVETYDYCTICDAKRPID